MVDYKELRKILNAGNMSVSHYANGKTAVRDSSTFKGLRLSAMDEAMQLVADAEEKDFKELAKKSGVKEVETLDSIMKRANTNVGMVIDCIRSGKNTSAQELKDKFTNPIAIRDSIFNGRWNLSNPADPSKANIALPNIYISPWEANSLYSQKGIFETVINKKAKSILLNGIHLENSKLSQKQIDTVKEKMEVRDFKNILACSTLNSLVYGGALVFPMFKKDTPVTTTLPLSVLLKLGVLTKDCIDYFVDLDRWQTFIIPPYNPTQKDFMRPDVYTIPFLGSDVHNTRTARVVTAKQAGYWGQVINQGWGISDLTGYLQSGMNYKVAVQSLPLMIQQMSILARVVNVDGVLATEGANALDALVETNTIKTREASADNPVTMDVLGDIKSIDRNFGNVPELLRLLRQDFASDANIPEPMLFSSEKGNFSSGDDTQGNLAKQYESVKMIHKDLEPQFKQLAKIMIIDALGTDKEVLEALPYTRLHFDEPMLANALERAQIGKFFSEEVFNLVSAQLPIDKAVSIACKNVSEDLVNADMLEHLAEIQAKVDKQDEERVRLELEQKKADIEQTKAMTESTEESVKEAKALGGNPTPSKTRHKGESEENEKTKGRSPAQEQREKALSDKEEKGYSKLEQKMHEKTRVGSTKRSEKLAKSKNKRV